MADHPRSRGVYGLAVMVMVMIMGSSPLARGLRLLAGVAGRRGRIIPARAGFTSGATCRRCNGQDHPRSRGVYRAMLLVPVNNRGSSPLARGLLVVVEVIQHLGRIIPARAGFTRTAADRRSDARDHPRSRGVYTLRKTSQWRICGSSPLARGLQRHQRHRWRDDRIIPARAGFTANINVSTWAAADHPRSRGVYPGT